MNANLSLPLLPSGTSPLTVVPTTGHGKELEGPWGRKGELIFKVNVIETWCSAINPSAKLYFIESF